VLLEDLERHDAEGGAVGAGEDDLGGGAGSRDLKVLGHWHRHLRRAVGLRLVSYVAADAQRQSGT